ncbi:MAG: aldehyde dehydrogenase family protein [Bdellovibrionota bacterium]
MKSVSAYSTLASPRTIETWRKDLSKLQDTFVAAVSKDTGRSEHESYLYDWMPVEATLQFLKGNIVSFSEPRRIRSGLPAMLGSRSLVERRLPLGKILVVGTWNFPLSLHLSQILFALAAGNSVVFKSSPFTPEVARIFATELVRIFGAERFSMWTGTDSECVSAVAAGQFQGLVFTGGSPAARIYARAAAESFTKCVLEASGSEAALIHPTAIASSKTEGLIDHLLWALLHFNGQTCVAPRYWFVAASQLDVVWTQLKATLATPAAAESFATRAPLRHEGVVKEFQAWVDWASSLKGAARFKPLETQPATFVRLERLADLPLESPSSFGPGAVIVGYESFSDAVEWVRKSPWSLMTQVYESGLSENEWNALQTLETSIVSLGESVTSVGDPAVSFGGKGLSGSGITHGIEGLRELSRLQVLLEAKSWPGTAHWFFPSFTRVNELKGRVGLLKAVRKGIGSIF